MELGKNRALAYKVLGENGEAFHGGTGSWPLPKNGKPGKWLFVEGAIQPCVNGLHLCRRDDLVHQGFVVGATECLIRELDGRRACRID